MISKNKFFQECMNHALHCWKMHKILRTICKMTIETTYILYNKTGVWPVHNSLLFVHKYGNSIFSGFQFHMKTNETNSVEEISHAVQFKGCSCIFPLNTSYEWFITHMKVIFFNCMQKTFTLLCRLDSIYCLSLENWK